jgi:catechol 2,3-dioxygenase-like lactoylglutathione lyase family enzyme
MTGSILGPIRAVTTTAADLDAVEDAYARHLGYRVRARGVVAESTAIGWGAPAVAGKPLLVMAPQSGNPTVLRFVEQALPEGYRPCVTYGWNATEIVVQDTDALEAALKGSPFDIRFPPKPLDGLPDIRAMQGIGPAGELLYLTWIQKPIPGHDLPVAASFVDQCFIAVAGGPDMEAMRGFYRDVFGAQPGGVGHPRIGVISSAYGLSPETTFPLATVPLGGGSLIELDEYPPLATERPRPEGGLPAGMAIVTFECPDLARVAGRLIAPPAPAGLPPYEGRPTATLVGAAGELIELIEV